MIAVVIGTLLGTLLALALVEWWKSRRRSLHRASDPRAATRLSRDESA